MKEITRHSLEIVWRRHLPVRARRIIQVLTGGRSMRSRAARWMAFPVLRHLTPAIMVRDGAVRCLVWTSDTTIGRSLFANRTQDSTQLAQALKVVASRLDLPTGAVFVDVGANIGTASLVALSTGNFRMAVSIEPDARNLELLRANVVLNGCSDRVHIVSAAASDVNGVEAEVEVDSRNFGDNRVLSPHASAIHRRVGTSVQTTTLVRLDIILPCIPGFSAKDALYWIDVQGHETEVLRGLGNLLDAAFGVVIELDPALHAPRAGLAEIASILSSSGNWFAELGPHVGQIRSTAELPQFVTELDRSYRGTNVVVFGRRAD